MYLDALLFHRFQYSEIAQKIFVVMYHFAFLLACLWSIEVFQHFDIKTLKKIVLNMR